jgi:hypothetical protein
LLVSGTWFPSRQVKIDIEITKVPCDTEGSLIAGMPAPGYEIWPANNKMVEVATIVASDPVSGLRSFTVTATSNEPAGKDPDILITGSGTQYAVQLRASRDGNGKGRTYTITAVAVDNAGNVSTAVTTCFVPHDKGK